MIMNAFEGTINPSDTLTMTCRLCLSVNEKLHQLFRLDETDTIAISLSMKVSLCTAISVSKNDMLPQKICQNCLNYVNEWYSFRKKCRDVDYFLRQKLSSKMEAPSNAGEETIKPLHLNSDVEGLNNFSNASADQLNAKANEINTQSSGNECNNNALVINEVPRETIDNASEPTGKFKSHRFKCSSCPDSFYHSKDLTFHKNLLHCSPEKENAAKRSQTYFDPDIKLDGINLRTRYEMKCCNKVFFSKLKFRRHYSRRHPGEKPFMCETCGKKDFISEETLKRHKILHTGKYRCEICSKTFTCNAILILHKRDKHENDKPFVCDVCGKRFVSELLMNYHKRFHTGEKKYVCEECGLAVVTSSSLAKHKRIHTKEKPHVCHVCGKGFIVRGRLMEHLRMHTGERPYVCHICQKGFTMKDKLKRHVRIHSGEKKISCEYCGNNYSTKYGLSIHLKSHLPQSK